MKPSDTITVHKEGEEGTLLVNAMTGSVEKPNAAFGKIITQLDDRPDWAEGLTTALLQERISFYEKRLGAESVAFKLMTSQTAAIEFSDLGWIGADAAGDEKEIFADPTYRSEVVAKALGINTEDGTMTGTVLAEREVSRENLGRTQSEIQALEDSVAQGFTGETARQQTERERRTGTESGG